MQQFKQTMINEIKMYVVLSCVCKFQLPSPSPSPKSKSNSTGKEEFGLWAVSKISWATHLKEASIKKTQRVKVTQYDPDLHKTGGQQEGEHG